MKKRYALENLGCADCANKMENEISKLPGVERAAINFMTAKLTVEAPKEKLADLRPHIDEIINRIEPDCKIR
ncbi:MAG TPA: heavy metal transporter [Clostridiaceae bacterium]|nr:heavy metal transporter [Clostridiaceae bacterium]